MKKIVAVLLFVMLLMPAYAKKKKEPKFKPVSSASDILDRLKQAGVDGAAAKYGFSKKILKFLGLQEYKGITSGNFSVGVYKFKSAWGFNRAVDLFQMLTMISQRAVYKERPYIIVVEGETTKERDAAADKLKAVMPHIREISEKDK